VLASVWSRIRVMRLAILAIVLLEAACRSACPGGCGNGTRPTVRNTRTTTATSSAIRRLGGARPALVIAKADSAQALLLALHGYGDTAKNFVGALGLPALARDNGFVLVAPDGMVDPHGTRFWNATDACCNFAGSDVDDVAYLRGLLREVAAAYHVDPRQRYVLGLSNGAFMAHRLACEAADEIAAIVPIAGTTWSDPGRCRPDSPVSVLQVHGDADRIVLYAGGADVLGRGKGAYPGSVATVERWARLNGCSGRFAQASPLLALYYSPATVTAVEQAAGCPAGVDVHLFTMHDAPHFPEFTPAFGDRVFTWLKAHPKVANPWKGDRFQIEPG
jgi:polyhydroxybutyrate depolymerase